MKYIATLSLVLAGFCCMAQQDAGPSLYSASATGSIFLPTLQCINIDVLENDAIQFSKAEEYDNGKQVPNFIRATVISNVPYLVSIMASGPGFSSDAGDAPTMPVSIISLRDNISNRFVSVTSAAQPLLVNKNNDVHSVYMVDAHFNPGWNYSGGQYNTTLVFTLTAQ